MAIERLFFGIKQNILISAGNLSAEATKLISEGNASEASAKLKAAEAELTLVSRVDEILPNVLQQLKDAGISQPPVSFFERVFEHTRVEPTDAIQSGPVSLELPQSVGTNVSKPDRPRGKIKPIDEIDNSPLAVIITSRARLVMLKTLFTQPGTPLYVREIARQTGLEINEVRREFAILGRANIVTESSSGNRRLIQLNPESPIFPIFSELFPPKITESVSGSPIAAGQVDQPPGVVIPKQDEIQITPIEETAPEDESRNLITQFRDTARYREIIEKLNSPIKSVNSIAEMDSLEGRLAGMLFEEVAYLHLLNKLNRNAYILTPSETSQLYRRLYPNRRVENNDGYELSFTVNGITMPDGLVIKPTNGLLMISDVVECKSSTRDLNANSRFLGQLQHFSAAALASDLFRLNGAGKDVLGEIVGVLRPDLPAGVISINPNLRTLVCVPANSTTLEVPAKNIAIEKVAITSYDLNLLTHEIMNRAKISLRF